MVVAGGQSSGKVVFTEIAPVFGRNGQQAFESQMFSPAGGDSITVEACNLRDTETTILIGDTPATCGSVSVIFTPTNSNNTGCAQPTHAITCTTPPGVGAEVPVIIKVGALTSESIVTPSTTNSSRRLTEDASLGAAIGHAGRALMSHRNRRLTISCADSGAPCLSYAAPIVQEVQFAAEDFANPGTYLDYVRVDSVVGGVNMDLTVPTRPGMVRIVGTNFGPRGTVEMEPPTSGPSFAAGVFPPTIGTPVWSNAAVMFRKEGGEGRGFRFRLFQGQPNTGDDVYGVQEPSSPSRIDFHHNAPMIGVASPARVSTTGGAIVLQGEHFGRYRVGQAVPMVSVMWPGATVARPCAVTAPLLTEDAHSTIRCVVPEGQGANVVVTVTVGGVSSSSVAGGAFRYNFPYPRLMAPPTAATEGGQKVVLFGGDFGLSGATIVFQRRQTPGAPLEQLVVPSMNVTEHNHSTIVFDVPEGQGLGWSVGVRVGEQFSLDDPAQVSQPLLFDYAPPAVFSVRPMTGRTIGGYDLIIEGSSFGLQGSRALIGGRSCELLPIIGSEAAAEVISNSGGGAGLPAAAIPGHTHTRIVCSAPAGMFPNQSVVVIAADGRSSEAGSVFFHYDPPLTTGVFPNPPNAEGELISLTGINFGTTETDVMISVGGMECTDAAWEADDEL